MSSLQKGDHAVIVELKQAGSRRDAAAQLALSFVLQFPNRAAAPYSFAYILQHCAELRVDCSSAIQSEKHARGTAIARHAREKLTGNLSQLNN